MIPGWIRPFVMVCAVYDVVLGAVFLVAHETVLGWFGIELPNHPAYVQFGAAYVLVMGIGFWLAARALERNRDILKLCLLGKIAYAGIVLGYAARGMMPGMWIPFAYIDTAMAIGIVAALKAIPAPGAAKGGAAPAKAA